MEVLNLSVSARANTRGALKSGRKSDLVPGVIYGNGSESTLVFVKVLDLTRAHAKAGESTIINLAIDGAKAPVSALIHDLAFNHQTGMPDHVDFYQVQMNQEMEAHIPLEFTGEAPAIKVLGGMLVKSLSEVVVRCMPADLPHALTLSLDSLVDFNAQLSVADITLPKGVKLMTDTAVVVATVAAPRSEAEMDALNTKVDVDVTKVESVVKKEKVEEEEKK